MQFRGRVTSPALAGTSQAFVLPYNNPTYATEDEATDIAMNSQNSNSGNKPRVAKRTPLPCTQKQYPLFANGELPRPRNGQPARRPGHRPPHLHACMIRSAKEEEVANILLDLRLPRILSPPRTPEKAENMILDTSVLKVVTPTPTIEEAAIILLGMGNPKVVTPSSTREEKATSLSSYGAKNRFNLSRPISSFGVRFNLPPQSMDNTSTAATTKTFKISNTSNIALPTPPPDQGTARTALFPNDNVEAEYFRLGLRRGAYPEPITPPGCASVDESNITAPTCIDQTPSWNYLMYTFLSVVPGNRYNTSKMIYAIMEWVPETVKLSVGQFKSKRHAQCANSRNPEVFVKVDRVDCRLRREGESVRRIETKEKRKGNHDNDNDEELDEPQPPKKKRATKKPATQNSKKGGKGKGKKATSGSVTLGVWFGNVENN